MTQREPRPLTCAKSHSTVTTCHSSVTILESSIESSRNRVISWLRKYIYKVAERFGLERSRRRADTTLQLLLALAKDRQIPNQNSHKLGNRKPGIATGLGEPDRFRTEAGQPLPGGVNQPQGRLHSGRNQRADQHSRKRKWPSTTTNHNWKGEVGTEVPKSKSKQNMKVEGLFKHDEGGSPSPAP